MTRELLESLGHASSHWTGYSAQEGIIYCILMPVAGLKGLKMSRFEQYGYQQQVRDLSCQTTGRCVTCSPLALAQKKRMTCRNSLAYCLRTALFPHQGTQSAGCNAVRWPCAPTKNKTVWGDVLFTFSRRSWFTKKGKVSVVARLSRVITWCMGQTFFLGYWVRMIVYFEGFLVVYWGTATLTPECQSLSNISIYKVSVAWGFLLFFKVGIVPDRETQRLMTVYTMQEAVSYGICEKERP